MKRIVLFLFFGFALTTTMLLGQDIYISPGTINVERDIDLSDMAAVVKGTADLTNTSGEDLSFRWVVTKVEGPAEWAFQMCDKNQCFATDVESNIIEEVGLNIPLSMDDNTLSIMELGLLPRGVAGCGTFIVCVTVVDEPETVVASAVYNFHVNTSPDECSVPTNVTCETISSTEEELAAQQIELYPNPNQGRFFLSENNVVEQVRIYNVNGSVMYSGPLNSDHSFDISALSNGFYFADLLSAEGQRLDTRKIVKQ